MSVSACILIQSSPPKALSDAGETYIILSQDPIKELSRQHLTIALIFHLHSLGPLGCMALVPEDGDHVVSIVTKLLEGGFHCCVAVSLRSILDYGGETLHIVPVRQSPRTMTCIGRVRLDMVAVGGSILEENRSSKWLRCRRV